MVVRVSLIRLKSAVQRQQDPYLNWEGWAALWVAVGRVEGNLISGIQITPEEAFRSLHKQPWTKSLLPECKALSEEILDMATSIIQNTPGITVDELEREVKCNRYILITGLKERRAAK